jgi:hypothetical protein
MSDPTVLINIKHLGNGTTFHLVYGALRTHDLITNHDLELRGHTACSVW